MTETPKTPEGIGLQEKIPFKDLGEYIEEISRSVSELVENNSPFKDKIICKSKLGEEVPVSCNMTIDNGEKGIFVYENKDHTLQRKTIYYFFMLDYKGNKSGHINSQIADITDSIIDHLEDLLEKNKKGKFGSYNYESLTGKQYPIPADRVEVIGGEELAWYIVKKKKTKETQEFRYRHILRDINGNTSIMTISRSGKLKPQEKREMLRSLETNRNREIGQK